MHQDDPRIIEKWNELTQIFSQDEKDTIAYLNSCSIDNVSALYNNIMERTNNGIKVRFKTN